MNRRAVSLAAVVLTTSGCDYFLPERIAMEEARLSVETPRGFQRTPKNSVWSSVGPILLFELDKYEDYDEPRYIGDPKVTLLQDASSTKESIDDYYSRIAERLKPHVRRLTVAGVPAIERVEDITVSHTRQQFIRHTIEFVYAGHRYECELVTLKSEHSKYAKTLQKFCGSIRFDSTGE